MTRGLATLCALACLALVACGDDDDTPAATLGTARTSTTLSVEAEVEAAYLRSWDVFAKAALNLDTSRLSEIYDGPALELVIADVEKFKADGTRGRYEVEHDYEIAVDGDDATVVDRYLNHSVLLDGKTREPIEPDPNELVEEKYLMRNVDGRWLVIDILR